MRTQNVQRVSEIAILFLLACTILWKGGKTLESTWMLMGVAGLCMLVQQRASRKNVRVSREDMFLKFLVLLSILWTSLSFLFSSTQNYGFDEILRIAGLGFLFLWTLQRPPSEMGNPSFEERFVRTFTILTVLACSTGFFIYLFQPVNRFVATFFDPRFHTDYWPNAAAQFLLLAWPIVLLQNLGPFGGVQDRFRTGEWGSIRPRFLSFVLRPQFLSHFVPGLVLGSLFLTYSRGAFLAFLGQLLLLFLVLLLRRKTVAVPGRPVLLTLFSIMVGIGVFLSVNHLRSFFHPVQSLEEKLTFSAAEGSSSISERLEFFKQAMVLTIEKPLLGWGPYSFRFVQPRLQDSPLATSDHPHNVLLKLSMEQGIPAALFFITIVGITLYRGMQEAFSGKRLHPGDNHRLGFTSLLLGIVGVLAHSLIDYNLQFVGIALPFFLMMGMVMHHRMQNEKLKMENEGRQNNFHSSFFILHFLAVLLISLAIREGYYLITSSLGRHAEARGEAQIALQWYNRSRSALFLRDLELSRANILFASGNLEKAEEAVRSYLAKNAEDSRAWNLLGSLLLMLEKYPEAIDALKKAFAYGSWNDLSISRHLLEALLAETYAQPTTDAAADSTHLLPHPDIEGYVPEMEKRVLAFVDAIRRNTHFTALSPNPEEAQKMLLMLSILSPERSEEFRMLDQVIKTESQEERLRTRARSPGWLW